MTLVNFALVVLGENFPVTTLDLRDFEFRHRKLRETLRLPLIMQAESDSVRLQVLAERFEIAVTRPDRVEVIATGAGVVQLVKDLGTAHPTTSSSSPTAPSPSPSPSA